MVFYFSEQTLTEMNFEFHATFCQHDGNMSLCQNKLFRQFHKLPTFVEPKQLFSSWEISGQIYAEMWGKHFDSEK